MYTARTKRRRVAENVARLNSEIKNHLEVLVPDTQLNLNVDKEIDNNIGSDISDVSSVSSDSEYTECFNDSMSTSEDPHNHSSIKLKLAEWSLKNNITHIALSELLKILQPLGCDLPLDARTLLTTPRSTDTADSPKYFHYFGIYKYLKNEIRNGLSNFAFPMFKHDNYSKDTRKLTITISTDGLPLSRSSKKCFWPILGKLDQAKQPKPFLIALYFGLSKPPDVNTFFKDLVDEMIELESTGLTINNIKYTLSISCIIADAPARSFLKCTVPYNAYYGCEKCEVKGQWKGRVIFKNRSSRLRSDESFKIMSNARHHNSKSPFSDLNVGLVTQVPLDYMHLVCLGVVRKFINIWVKGKPPHRLSLKNVQSISSKLISLCQNIPAEFARKPRALTELDHFKATEFRLFLLYTAPVSLIDILSEEKYKHFMYLHTAMFILISRANITEEWNSYAKNLLLLYVKLVPKLYDETMLVYNVHSIIHLADDAVRFGALDNFSAFPFENYMQHLKKKVRGQRRELTQIIHRVAEDELWASSHKNRLEENRLIKSHRFSKYTYNGTVISSDQANCYFYTHFNKLIKVFEVIQQNGHNVMVKYKELLNLGSLVHYPCDSTKLGIYKINLNEVSKEKSCLITELVRKYVVLPLGNSSDHCFCGIPYSDDV